MTTWWVRNPADTRSDAGRIRPGGAGLVDRPHHVLALATGDRETLGRLFQADVDDAAAEVAAGAR